MSPQTVTVEVTRREQREVIRTLRVLAGEKEAAGEPGETNRLRGLASRVERE